MHHLIKTPGPLLTAQGSLTEPGYATSLLLDYQRSAIKAHPLRIKEWDYYLILCDTHALALTIADNAYMGLDSISFLDFTVPKEHTNSKMRLFPMGKTGLPASSAQGDVSIQGKAYAISFAHTSEGRRITCRMDNFQEGMPLSADILLTDEPDDSMVIATPFAGKPKAFYYNQKINCMRAQGEVRIGEKAYAFDPSTAFGTLDWGRGVWTYFNTWYWGSANGYIGSLPFGMNIGYGFGDTTAASENMLFYDGKAHKLDQIDFGIPTQDGRDDFMAPWHITSNDDRLDLHFAPVIDRASKTSVGVIYSDQHQVLGRFSGKAVLDDGQVLPIENLMGFAEKVSNKW